MRVAIVVWRFPMLSEPFVLNQITGLLDRGHDVEIVALKGAPLEATAAHAAVERYGLLERRLSPPEPARGAAREALQGLRLLSRCAPARPRVALALLREALGRRGWPTELVRRAAGCLDAGPYDVVHCQFGTVALGVLRLRRLGLLQGRLVTTFRGIDISQHVQREGPRVYERLFREGSFFLANCAFFRDRAVSLGCPPDRIAVHGSGIDCAQFPFAERRPPASGPVRVAATGRLVEKKGITYAIDAVAALVAAGRSLELRIVGAGPLRAELEQQARALGLADRVRFHGWRPHHELVEILAECQLFLAPSVTAADGNQDAPVNTLKEAMAMGLPVVSARHGGIPELVEDGVNGLLAPERDAGALAERLGWLLDHPERWPELARRGRAAVEERYDMHRLNDELVRIYERVVDAPAARPDDGPGLVALPQEG